MSNVDVKLVPLDLEFGQAFLQPLQLRGMTAAAMKLVDVSLDSVELPAEPGEARGRGEQELPQISLTLQDALAT